MSQVTQTDNPLVPRRWGWKRLAGSKFLVGSLIFHLLLGVGATIYIVQRSVPQRKMTFSGGPPSTNPSKKALEHKVALGKKSKSMSAPAQAKRITVNNALSKVALAEMPTMPTANDVIPNRMAGLGGIGTGFGAGGGGGMGGGGGGGSGINFFGLRATARSVVFCVDISSSMIHGKKNEASYQTFENELIKAIKGLAPTMRFAVVAFSGEATAYRDSLTDARPDEKDRACNWYKKQTPTIINNPKATEAQKNKHHGTRHDLALEKAFAMKPDVIFVASDGEPSKFSDDEVHAKVEELVKSTGRRPIINAIAYMADDGQKFMKDLAEKNKGSFREVNP